MSSLNLQYLPTPTLLLDEHRLLQNIQRMQARMDQLGVRFRPHVKTSKSPLVVERQLAAGASGITVSTLKEADQFFNAGVTDVLYAVAITPAKLDQALTLARPDRRLLLLVDSVDAARHVTYHGLEHHHRHEVLIEISTDHYRAGLAPDDPHLLEIADALTVQNGHGAHLAGVLTHAGSSYKVNTPDALARIAELERASCVQAAEQLRTAGHDCEIVSVGSTPTALSATRLDGVTEVRAGAYAFFDLVMHNIGVCTLSDIAISVLTAVIGHQPERGQVLVDAGWSAMSRDRGTQEQTRDFGYGLVCDLDGHPLPDLAFVSVSQEHGILQWTGPSSAPLTSMFPIGRTLRILPNHACATSAQFDEYTVLPEGGGPLQHWPRFRGW